MIEPPATVVVYIVLYDAVPVSGRRLFAKVARNSAARDVFVTETSRVAIAVDGRIVTDVSLMAGRGSRR